MYIILKKELMNISIWQDNWVFVEFFITCNICQIWFLAVPVMDEFYGN